jgi:hypothetical protein
VAADSGHTPCTTELSPKERGNHGSLVAARCRHAATTRAPGGIVPPVSSVHHQLLGQAGTFSMLHAMPGMTAHLLLNSLRDVNLGANAVYTHIRRVG